jgi:hypothetical protein
MADQKKQSPPAPTLLSLKVGGIKEVKNGFIVPLIAKLFKGTSALKNVEITFKQGATEVGKAITDQTGEAVFNHIAPLSDEDKAINFRAIAETNESSENAVIPKKAEKKAKKRKGPKIMKMSRYHHFGRPGVYTVWAEVQGENGSAYKGRVVFWVRGQQHEVQADHNGYAELMLTPIVQEDEILIITASIHEEHDGIVDSAFLKLRRPRIWARGWTAEWLRSARGIAGVARWVVMLCGILFIMKIFSSDYQPVLMPKNELSEQQKRFNETFHDNQIVLPQAKTEFPGGQMMSLLFIALVIYGFSLFANLGMLRDCVITAYDNISNNFRSQVSDPLSERILEWFKLLSVSKDEKHKDKDPQESEAKVKKAGLSFSKLFASEIIAEIVGEIAVKILPAILSKTKLKNAF